MRIDNVIGFSKKCDIKDEGVWTLNMSLSINRKEQVWKT